MSKASSAPDFSGVTQFVQGNRNFFIIIAIVLVLAVVINFAASAGLQDMAKKSQAEQQAQMAQSMREHAELIERQKIAWNTEAKAALASDVTLFLAAVQYDVTQLNATLYQYGMDNVSSANLGRKAAAAELLAVQLNEFFSHWDGFIAFMRENAAEIQRLGGESQNETQIAEQAKSVKELYKSIAAALQKDLSDFAGSDPAKQAEIARAVELLEGVKA